MNYFSILKKLLFQMVCLLYAHVHQGKRCQDRGNEEGSLCKHEGCCLPGSWTSKAKFHSDLRNWSWNRSDDAHDLATWCFVLCSVTNILFLVYLYKSVFYIAHCLSIACDIMKVSFQLLSFLRQHLDNIHCTYIGWKSSNIVNYISIWFNCLKFTSVKICSKGKA